MDKATYKKVWSCLHPDRIRQLQHEPTERLLKLYAEAFDKFSYLEKLLLSEKESPTDTGLPMPQTVAERLALRAQAQRERAAKRAAGKAGVSVR